MKKIFRDRARIVIYLDRQELDAVKEEAGDIPLSNWCRKKLFNGKNEDLRSADLPRSEEVPVPKQRGAGRSERIRAPVPSCEHGTEKGYRCWQCGGMAKIG